MLRSLSSALVLLGLTAPALAQNTISGTLRLEATEPVLAGTSDLTLRTPYAGTMVFLVGDLSLGSLYAGSVRRPVLSVTPSFTLIASGTTDSAGRFTTTVPMPSVAIDLVLQGVVLDPQSDWWATNAVNLDVGSTSTAIYSDGTIGLDPITTVFGWGATDVDFADLDKDGCLDAVVTYDSPGYGALLMGSCDGNFEDQTALRLPLEAVRATSTVAIGDANGDSWPDLFLGGGFAAGRPAADRIVFNDGTGNFRLSFRDFGGELTPPRGGLTKGGARRNLLLPPGAGRAFDAGFADIDADGDQDLVVMSESDAGFPEEEAKSVVLYRNMGNAQGGDEGSFEEEFSFFDLTSGNPHNGGGGLLLEDLDADGDVDILVGRNNAAAGGSQNSLYLNDGTGSFTDATSTALPVVADNTYAFASGDFDGDGDVDVFVANSIVSDPTAVHFLENVSTTPGTPLFVDGSAGRIPASLGEASDIRLCCDAGDVDGDGDLDLVVGIHQLFGTFGQPDGESVILLNQGGAQGGVLGEFLVDTGFNPSLFITGDVAFGDVDADGDLDVYVASGGDLFGVIWEDDLILNDL